MTPLPMNVKLRPFISVPFASVEKREPSLLVLNQIILLVSTFDSRN